MVMMKAWFLCVTLSHALPLFAQQPVQTLSTKNGVTGVVKRHEKFSSKFVDARNVDVWLPASYERNKSKRYPVVYLHDGQMLFDATTTWNHQECSLFELHSLGAG
jgi:enterochelin esterase-like enzyme